MSIATAGRATLIALIATAVTNTNALPAMSGISKLTRGLAASMLVPVASMETISHSLAQQSQSLPVYTQWTGRLFPMGI